MSVTSAYSLTSRGFLSGALALGVFLAGLFLYTRGNDFPAHYHPDEPGKVRQIREGHFNFNHPLLLLRVTRLLIPGDLSEADQHFIVRRGRMASAIFSAAAAAFLVLAAARIAGWGAAGLTGFLVLSNHQIYELAHYMKEDPSLLFGVAATLAAFVAAVDRATLTRFVALGGACALAASGKYLGVMALFFGVAAILAAPQGRRLVLSLGFLGGFLMVVAAINYPMAAAFSDFASHLGREVDFVVGGHKGMTRQVPHGVYGAVFRTSTNPAIWALVGLYSAALVAWVARRKIRQVVGILRDWSRETRWSLWALAIFPLLYTLVLSFSPKTHHRYFLPVTAILLLQAGLAPFLLRPGRARKLAMGVALVAILAGAWKTASYDRAFQEDTRVRLAAFLREQIPADAVIVQDKRVGLPLANDDRGDDRFEDSRIAVPQKILGKGFAADQGTLSELRDRGVGYVAVATGDYGRFFLKTHTPRPEAAAAYARRRQFYDELFSTGQLIWESSGGRIPYLQPDIRLYRIAPAL